MCRFLHFFIEWPERKDCCLKRISFNFGRCIKVLITEIFLGGKIKGHISDRQHTSRHVASFLKCVYKSTQTCSTICKMIPHTTLIHSVARGHFNVFYHIQPEKRLPFAVLLLLMRMLVITYMAQLFLNIHQQSNGAVITGIRIRCIEINHIIASIKFCICFALWVLCHIVTLNFN